MTEEVKVLVEEYKTVREESLASIGHRNQIVSLGLAAIGIVFAGAVSRDNLHSDPQLVDALFKIAIPSVALLILYMWLGEVARMMRAGAHLVDLEVRINAAIKAKALSWEKLLRTSQQQMRFPYVVVFGLFLGLAIGSPMVGDSMLGRSIFRPGHLSLLVWGIEFCVVVHLFVRARELLF